MTTWVNMKEKGSNFIYRLKLISLCTKIIPYAQKVYRNDMCITPKSHYGKTHLCRASKSLSCALFRVHDKGLVCRAFFIRRTAKKKRTAQVLFAVR
jgi:hypothetical protein